LRLDKIRIAALEATLRLYRDPDRLADRLPTLRLLARSASEIRAMAQRLQPAVAKAVGPEYRVEVVACASQIGSGALPLHQVPSAGLAIRPVKRRHQGSAIDRISARLRQLRLPIIGRVEDQALLLDLRCLEDEAGFSGTIAELGIIGAQ